MTALSLSLSLSLSICLSTYGSSGWQRLSLGRVVGPGDLAPGRGLDLVGHRPAARAGAAAGAAGGRLVLAAVVGPEARLLAAELPPGESDAQRVGGAQEGLEPGPRHRRAARVHQSQQGGQLRALDLRENHRDRLALAAARGAVAQQHFLQQIIYIT